MTKENNGWRLDISIARRFLRSAKAHVKTDKNHCTLMLKDAEYYIDNAISTLGNDGK